MDISDVSNLLGITITTDQLQMYEARLDAAISQAKQYCNNPFLDENGNEAIPAGAQMGIALLVQGMGEKQNVASQSLGDMSKSFFQGGTMASAQQHLKPFRKAGFR